MPEKRGILRFIPDEAKDKIIVGMVLGIIGVGGVSGSGVFRIGKFTSEDGLRMERRIDAIERSTSEAMLNDKTCMARVNRLEEKVDYFQRKYWERANK